MIMDNKRAAGSPDGTDGGEHLAGACYVSPVFHPPRTPLCTRGLSLHLPIGRERGWGEYEWRQLGSDLWHLFLLVSLCPSSFMRRGGGGECVCVSVSMCVLACV